ncbi:MAG: hypothetical protein HY343_10015 [Lentisphaerae bacterium]|nr:hypothetical protein [Lentisphaerota bacterium]
MADKKHLKNSYDLILERLAARGESVKAMTPEQKKAISEIESTAKAKVAELEIMMKQKMAEAGGDPEKIQPIRELLSVETAKVREKAEAEKERIRKGTT